MWNKYRVAEEKIRISLDMEKVRYELTGLVQYADVVFLGKDLAMHIGAQTKKEAVYKLRASTRPG